MGGLLQDVRIAARRLVQAPGLTLIVVLTFALGIGANTALFTLFDRVLLRPLPVTAPDRLVMLHAPGPTRGMRSQNKSEPAPMSHPEFKAFRDRGGDALAGVLAYFGAPVHLAVGEQPERVQAELVTGTYFDVLGLTAAQGRLITRTDDEHPMSHPVVVLGHAYWTRRFAGNPGIVGTTVSINALPMTVIGVAPDGFRGLEVGSDPAVYIPVAMKRQITPTWDMLDDPHAYWLTVIGRLRDDVTAGQAAASLNVIYKQLLADVVAQMPGTLTETGRARLLGKTLLLPSASAGASGFREQTATPLRILVTTAGLVLLVACLNVANLLFVRATRRQKEIAVRLSLGAGRVRLVRQLIVEGALLAILGAAAGVFVAAVTVPMLVALLPDPDQQRALAAGVDTRMLAFATLAGLLCVLLSAVLPAWHATRVSLTPSLREGSGATSARGHQLRSGLVVAQVALSLGLVFGAGLLVRTLAQLASASPGFEVTRLLTFSVSPDLSGYSNDQRRVTYQGIIEQVRALPDVGGVGGAELPVLADSTSQNSIRIDGYEPAPDENMNPVFNTVSPGFFDAIGARLVAGRHFDTRDNAKGAPAMMVNENFARHYFKEAGAAIGKRVSFGRDDDVWYDIVGVVSNFRHRNLREDPSERMVFVHYAQSKDLTSMTFYVRIRASEANAAIALRDAVRRVDPALPLYDVRTMASQRDASIFSEHTSAVLAGAFAVVGVLLAALGLYGTLSYGVGLRVREIGVRLALGADPADIVRMVARQALLVVAIGVAVGVPVAYGVASLVRSQLFGVPAFDPIVAGGAVGVLAFAAALATYVPALRAARVNPATTLRYE